MDFDVDAFETGWKALADEVTKRVMANEQVAQIKTALQSNGFLTSEQKNDFIVIADRMKSEAIKERYGDEAGEPYQKFLADWQLWQKQRGHERAEPKDRFEQNANHFLYGSTPNPEEFLKD